MGPSHTTKRCHVHPWGALPNNPDARVGTPVARSAQAPVVIITRQVVAACGKALAAAVGSSYSEPPLRADGPAVMTLQSMGGESCTADE